jgi:hypothetical protein
MDASRAICGGVGAENSGISGSALPSWTVTRGGLRGHAGGPSQKEAQDVPLRVHDGRDVWSLAGGRRTLKMEMTVLSLELKSSVGCDGTAAERRCW